MALHEIIQIKKVSILGNEITTKRKFIKYTPTTVNNYVPESGVVSQASRLFKYDFEHPYMGPTLHISNGKKYLLPMWKEVHPETTYNDINIIRPTKVEVKEKGTWKFESSSDPSSFYFVRQNGTKLSCTCPGTFRAKDKRCKHIKQVEKELNK